MNQMRKWSFLARRVNQLPFFFFLNAEPTVGQLILEKVISLAYKVDSDTLCVHKGVV